jgi:hypothetical protein
MKKLLIKSCGTCPLNTWNIDKELIDIQCCCTIDPDHDISYDITLKEQTCIITKEDTYEYITGNSIPRNCPLEDEKEK